jgi:hypothetical protein
MLENDQKIIESDILYNLNAVSEADMLVYEIEYQNQKAINTINKGNKEDKD